MSQAGHRSGQGKGLGEAPGRESHQGLGAAGARHGPAPTSGRPAPPSPRAPAGPAPQPIPARRRGVAAPACGLRRVGGPGAGNMEELLKRELGCDSVKATGHSGGGCISQGQSYDTDKGRVFVKVNSKPEVRVAAGAGWGAGPGRGSVRARGWGPVWSWGPCPSLGRWLRRRSVTHVIVGPAWTFWASAAQLCGPSNPREVGACPGRSGASLCHYWDAVDGFPARPRWPLP